MACPLPFLSAVRMASVSEILAFSIACASWRALSDANAAPIASTAEAPSSNAVLTGPDWVLIELLLVCLDPNSNAPPPRGVPCPAVMLRGRHAPGTVARLPGGLH